MRDTYPLQPSSSTNTAASTPSDCTNTEKYLGPPTPVTAAATFTSGL